VQPAGKRQSRQAIGKAIQVNWPFLADEIDHGCKNVSLISAVSAQRPSTGKISPIWLVSHNPSTACAET
jgi:hypothetical protein